MPSVHVFWVSIAIGAALMCGGFACTLAYLSKKSRYFDRRLNLVSTLIERDLTTKLLSAVTPNLQEIQTLISVSNLGFRYPLFIGGWSIDAATAKYLIDLLLWFRPRTVVELGSGASTLLIARCLETLGEHASEHIAIDHESDYLNRTRLSLEANGLENRVQLWHCPLSKEKTSGLLWYEEVPLRLKERTIDLLLIDGPPSALQDMSRYPALPVLVRNLSKRAIVILDDAKRVNERRVIERWLKEFPEWTVSELGGPHGAVSLTRICNE